MTEIEDRTSGGCLKPFLVVSCVFLPINFVGGAMFGQSAGMLPQLMDKDSFIHITSEEGTWIASSSVIGTLIASCLGGTLSDMFGRVRACQVGYLCFCIGYGVMAGADRVVMLLLGRFFIGLGFGFYFPALVYVSELAPPAYRGLLLSLTPLESSAGLVYIYIVGGYLPWNIAAGITCLLSIIGLCLTFLCYDSPPWLIRKNRIEDARKSLKWIEHPENVEAKLEELQNIAANQAKGKPVSIRTFVEATVWKPFLIILAISVLQNASGFYIIIYYTVNFMKEFHSTFDPLQITIAVGVVRLVAIVISSYLLRRMGRRTIGALSGFSSAVLLFLIFAYLSFEKTCPYLSEYSWIPISLFLAFILTMTLGIYPLPWTMPHELFPIKVRGAMCGASFAAMSVFMFSSVKLYYVLVDNLGLQGLILMFAIGSLLFGIFSVTLLAETHRKTLNEIEQAFLGKNDKLEGINMGAKSVETTVK